MVSGCSKTYSACFVTRRGLDFPILDFLHICTIVFNQTEKQQIDEQNEIAKDRALWLDGKYVGTSWLLAVWLRLMTGNEGKENERKGNKNIPQVEMQKEGKGI
jgi:hypothetical protein